MTYLQFADRNLHALTCRVTGRELALFGEDVASRRDLLVDRIAGRRVLVAGGAGSLGSATVYQLLAYRPETLCILDLAENNLVEVLRSIRSSPSGRGVDLVIQPVDMGSPIAERFLAQAEPFDLVFNFAAAKHVRSERDPVSLLQMIDTNLIKADRFLGWLRQYGHGRDGVFFVSSDKAANPANLMGASKRIMEQMLFWHTSPQAAGRTLLRDAVETGAPLGRATSARFANVAFSDGSLPFGFLQRLAKRQPLAGPCDVRRFLLSMEEAGQLCLLAGSTCPSGWMLAPRLDPSQDMVTFQDIAASTLAHFGYEPLWFDRPEAALEGWPQEGRGWPCHFSSSDTMGEKAFEEFAGAGEGLEELGYGRLVGIRHQPSVEGDRLREGFARLAAWHANPSLPVTKADLMDVFRSMVPSLQWQDSDLCLDGKM